MHLPGRFFVVTLRLDVAFFFLITFTACSSQQAQAPPPKPPLPLEFLGEWGKKGNGPGQLSYPSSIAVDSVGNVYITDLGSGFVHKFTAQGEPLFSFQEPGLRCPDGIAVDQGGGIYVTDPGKGNVFVFFPNGDHLRTIHVSPSRKCKEPLAISVDAVGNLFVVHSGQRVVKKLNPKGRVLQDWGGRKTPGRPAFDPADVIAVADGFFYVTDNSTHRLLKYGEDGTLAGTFAVPETEPGPLVLAGLAISSKFVFASDPHQKQIYVWSKDGTFLHAEDLRMRLQTPEPSPVDLALTVRGELLVLDPKGARVLRFRVNL